MEILQKKSSKIAQIYYYDPQSAGINVQSPQSESTPRRLTLNKVETCLGFQTSFDAIGHYRWHGYSVSLNLIRIPDNVEGRSKLMQPFFYSLHCSIK